MRSGTLFESARQAWVYGLPLIEFANVRYNVTEAQRARGQPAVANRFNHGRVLATARSRAVTAPNVDTLYSSAFIDLAGGPVTITLPATGDRYFSMQLMDAYTNSFCILGTRTTGPDGGTFILAGPTDAAPPGAIRSPTPWVWALGRVLVDDEADYPGAHAVQDGIQLEAGPARTPVQFATREAPWAACFTSLQRLLGENPPPATDTAFLGSIAPLGLSLSGEFDPARFSGADTAEIEAGVAAARQDVLGGGATAPQQGWSYPPANLGDWGQDYLTRGTVALSGLAALPLVEATYCGAWTPDGKRVFVDDNAYLLHFDAGQMPPAGAFWSLTLYERMPNGQSFLAANPIDRYAIRDRTPGLRYNADGSLDIWISREDPGGERTSNWLPAPVTGPYTLSMRCYLPESSLLRGQYKLPALVAA